LVSVSATLPDMTTTVRKPRGPYAKTSARRREIVDAAVEVFSSGGYHKGSLRDVSDRVGLSQAGLLHHYPSKDSLLEAVLNWRDDDASAFLGDPLPQGLDLLRGLVRLAEYNASTPELVRLHVILSAEGTLAEHPLHEYFVNRHRQVIDMAKAAFERVRADGRLAPDVDPGSAARSVMGLMDGLQVQWLLDREGVDMAAHLRHYIRSLLTVEL
jgi:AcrR family transcriptional regulator